jgi:hypothetical protein
MSWEAEYITALVELMSVEGEITVHALADKFNEGKMDRVKVTDRKAGSAVRNELKLKTERITSGENKGKFGIQIDREQIKALCLRYGVDIPEQSSLSSLSSPQDQVQSEHSEGSEHKENIKVLEGTVFNPCYTCGSKKFWKTKFGTTVCATCHPPVDDNEVVEWLDLEHTNG